MVIFYRALSLFKPFISSNRFQKWVICFTVFGPKTSRRKTLLFSVAKATTLTQKFY